jgi:predicted XRE-type DNA-binding protein
VTNPTNSSTAPGARVVTGQLHRVQRGHGKRFAPEPPPGAVRRPARVAVMLALAHKIQQAIDTRTVRDRAEVARRLGFTRARVTHLMDLTLLAPDLQERVLGLEAVDGVEPISERAVRDHVLKSVNWRGQREAWSALRGSEKASDEPKCS